MKIGRNGRGNKPVMLLDRPLRTVELLLEIDGVVQRLKDRDSCSLLETVVQTLRTTPGELAFGFAGGRVLHQEKEPEADQSRCRVAPTTAALRLYRRELYTTAARPLPLRRA